MQKSGANKRRNFYTNNFFHPKKKNFILAQKTNFKNEKISHACTMKFDFPSKEKSFYTYPNFSKEEIFVTRLKSLIFHAKKLLIHI